MWNNKIISLIWIINEWNIVEFLTYVFKRWLCGQIRIIYVDWNEQNK